MVWGSWSNPPCQDTTELLLACKPETTQFSFGSWVQEGHSPNLSRGPVLTPTSTDEGHPNVVGVDSRDRVTSPGRALGYHWTHGIVNEHSFDGVESAVVPHLKHMCVACCSPELTN